MKKVTLVGIIALLLFPSGNVYAGWVDYTDIYHLPDGCRSEIFDQFCIPPEYTITCTYYYYTQTCCCEGLLWAPDPPNDITTAVEGNTITIQWESDPAVVEYRLWWDTDAAISLGSENRFIFKGNSFTHNNLQYNKRYYYYLRAVGEYGHLGGTDFHATTGSNPNPPPLLPPPAPQGFNAISNLNEVSLSWRPVSGASQYHIYWSKQTGVMKTQFEGKIDGLIGTSYTHTDETPGVPLNFRTSYYYIVTAENTTGVEGFASVEVQVTTGAPIPPTIVPIISLLLF